MSKNKSITTGEIQQMAKIIHSMNLSYLYEVEPSLILNPKIIGDSSDLIWIKEKTKFASRVFEREIEHQIYLINEFKAIEGKEEYKGLYLAYKQLFPDTFEYFEKRFSISVIREILVNKFLSNTLYVVNHRENTKTVYDITKELISFKESIGLKDLYVPALEIFKRTTLSTEDFKEEINRLVQLKKIRFERIGHGILIYLNN